MIAQAKIPEVILDYSFSRNPRTILPAGTHGSTVKVYPESDNFLPYPWLPPGLSHCSLIWVTAVVSSSLSFCPLLLPYRPVLYSSQNDLYK